MSLDNYFKVLYNPFYKQERSEYSIYRPICKSVIGQREGFLPCFHSIIYQSVTKGVYFGKAYPCDF